jgi:hypothetical protein
VYPGGGDYQGLFVEEDVSEDAFGAAATVGIWVKEALAVVRLAEEPHRATGAHCSSPYACGFSGYCSSKEPQAEYPVAWLPRIQTKALKAAIERDAIIDLRHVPDDLLNAKQLRVKTHTLSGKAYFGAERAATALNTPISYRRISSISKLSVSRCRFGGAPDRTNNCRFNSACTG